MAQVVNALFHLPPGGYLNTDLQMVSERDQKDTLTDVFRACVNKMNTSEDLSNISDKENILAAGRVAHDRFHKLYDNADKYCPGRKLFANIFSFCDDSLVGNYETIKIQMAEAYAVRCKGQFSDLVERRENSNDPFERKFLGRVLSIAMQNIRPNAGLGSFQYQIRSGEEVKGRLVGMCPDKGRNDAWDALKGKKITLEPDFSDGLKAMKYGIDYSIRMGLSSIEQAFRVLKALFGRIKYLPYELVEAWNTQDAEKYERLTINLYPWWTEIVAEALFDMNDEWLNGKNGQPGLIEQLQNTQEPINIAVEAWNLFGNRGMIQQLADANFTVTRVNYDR